MRYIGLRWEIRVSKIIFVGKIGNSRNFLFNRKLKIKKIV